MVRIMLRCDLHVYKSQQKKKQYEKKKQLKTIHFLLNIYAKFYVFSDIVYVNNEIMVCQINIFNAPAH